MEELNDRSGRLLAAALEYAERGWFVFPVYGVDDDGICMCRNGSGCGSPGKHPITKRGFKDASTDADQIRGWWQHHPLANVAVASGASRLVVVDVDPRNGGDDTLPELESTEGALPDTVRALTGGGGSHEFFSAPEGEGLQGTPLGQGVDVKARGGYVVVAPSRHASGHEYVWDVGALPEETAVAQLPEWIVNQLSRRRPVKGPEGGGEVTSGLLGAAFQEAGLLGRQLGGGKAAVRCPWSDEHTTGKPFDTSTVVFAPAGRSNLGWFDCKHEHCRGRKPQDVLDALDLAAVTRARRRIHPTRGAHCLDNEAEVWESRLTYRRDGLLTRDPGNAALLIANHPKWVGCLAYDEFADRVYWMKLPPPMPGLSGPAVGEELQDHHIVYVQQCLAFAKGVSFPKAVIHEALLAAARLNRRHPPREYLESLTWDGVPRLDRWLSTYLGAEDTEYTRAVGRWWMISAIARIYEPGCQADHLLVLEGKQGVGKSSAVRILAGPWCLGSLPDIRNKDAAHVLQGNWIVEIGELDALRGAGATRVKDFVSQPMDSYRPAYARCTVRRPRTCVFIGTTNETEYLDDGTGARRFWPVTVTGLVRESLARDRDQLWAEARDAYRSGETWWPDADLAALVCEEQEARYRADTWEHSIAEWVERKDQITVAEVLGDVLEIEKAKWDRRAEMRVAECLKRLGWRRKKVTVAGRRIWAYRKDQ